LVWNFILCEYAGIIFKPTIWSRRLLLKVSCSSHISLTDIFRGFAPFIVIQLIVLACVMFFPEMMTQNFHEFVPKK